MKELILILALVSMHAFAAGSATTYKSGVVPMNGTYNLSVNSICAVDSSYANSLPPTTGKNELSLGYHSFTPDTSKTSTISSLDAYNKWISYVSGLTGVSAPILSQTPDPTNPSKMLNETPIQWGIGNQSSYESDVSTPYTSSTASYINIENAYMVVTQYTYSNSALANGVTTGYAMYRLKNTGPWNRLLFFPSAFTTNSANNLVFLGYKTANISNNYNCRANITMTR